MSKTVTVKSFEDNYDLSLADCHSFEIELGDTSATYYTNYTPPMGLDEYAEYLQMQVDLSMFEDLVKQSDSYNEYSSETVTITIDPETHWENIWLSYSEYEQVESKQDNAEERYNKAMKVID